MLKWTYTFIKKFCKSKIIETFCKIKDKVDKPKMKTRNLWKSMGYICKCLLIKKYLYKSNICICNMVIDHQMFLQTHGYLPFLQIFEQKEKSKCANPIHLLFLPPQNAYDKMQRSSRDYFCI